VLRIAAIGDTHYAEDTRGRFRPLWQRLPEEADVFLLCGDLTNLGTPEQAEGFAAEIRELGVPTVAVLGNHDYHANEAKRVRRALEQSGVTVLEGESVELRVNGETLGIAGAKGFGGGFVGACGHAFGEAEMKEFMNVTEAAAARLEDSLRALKTDHRVALLHYSPVKDTLAGERLEIYPFLGSFRLAEALDSAGADLVIHGHAHHGTEKGITAGGIPVRNVAMPLIRRPYAIYELEREAPLQETTFAGQEGRP
jgi:Icc-related predicted phosphoesterase